MINISEMLHLFMAMSCSTMDLNILGYSFMPHIMMKLKKLPVSLYIYTQAHTYTYVFVVYRCCI